MAQSLTLICPGNECSWTNVTTLGACASCEDMRSQTKTQCATDDELEKEPVIGAQCNFTVAQEEPLRFTWMNAEDAADPTTVDATGKNLLTSLSGEFEQPKLASFALVKASVDKAKHNFAISEAWTCEFSLCARRYGNVTSVNGTRNLVPARSVSLLMNMTSVNSANVRVPVPLTPAVNETLPDHTTLGIGMADLLSLSIYFAALFSLEDSSGGGGSQVEGPISWGTRIGTFTTSASSSLYAVSKLFHKYWLRRRKKY